MLLEGGVDILRGELRARFELFWIFLHWVEGEGAGWKNEGRWADVKVVLVFGFGGDQPFLSDPLQVPGIFQSCCQFWVSQGKCDPASQEIADQSKGYGQGETIISVEISEIAQKDNPETEHIKNPEIDKAGKINKKTSPGPLINSLIIAALWISIADPRHKKHSRQPAASKLPERRSRINKKCRGAGAKRPN